MRSKHYTQTSLIKLCTFLLCSFKLLFGYVLWQILTIMKYIWFVYLREIVFFTNNLKIIGNKYWGFYENLIDWRSNVYHFFLHIQYTLEITRVKKRYIRKKEKNILCLLINTISRFLFFSLHVFETYFVVKIKSFPIQVISSFAFSKLSMEKSDAKSKLHASICNRMRRKSHNSRYFNESSRNEQHFLLLCLWSKEVSRF